MTQQTEAARIDRIAKELQKTVEMMQRTQTTMFYVLEEKRRMNDIIFKYAEGLDDGGELARKFLNKER